MRIGIDIDGVLTNIERWQLDFGSRYFFKDHLKIENYKAYEIKDVFGVSLEKDDQFWSTYLKEYVTKETARKFASEVILDLKQKGHEIIIITARVYTMEDSSRGRQMRKIVKNWLQKNKIFYDELIFSPEDKLNICLENHIDVMIEDKKENIEKISTKIPVICMHAGYNEECYGKRIIRCHSWYDIGEVIDEKIITD